MSSTAGRGRDDSESDRESPPRRLTDGPAPTPGSAEELVVAFLRAAEPYRTPVGRKTRLRATLAGRRALPARAFSRPAFASGLALCAAAAVSAHLLGWPHRLAERAPGHAAAVGDNTAPEPVAPTIGATHEATAPPKREPPVTAPPPSIAGASPRPQLVPGQSAPTLRHRHRPNPAPVSRELAVAEKDPPFAEAAPAPESAPNPVDAAKAESTDADEAAALALAALGALRRDHDPARAREMVDAYLRAHPDGAMAEEVLAISIEAAAAHRDADANVLAARYLARYPSGTFRALARKTLRSDLPSP